MSKVVSAREAVSEIPNGATITASGCIGWLVPEMVLRALEDRYLEEGSPGGLTIVEPSPIGPGPGQEHWLSPGMVKRLVTSALDQAINPELTRKVLDGAIEAYAFPLGAMHQLMEQIGRRTPGLLSRVGLETYVDPRLGGGRYNTDEDLVELVNFAGEERLLYKSMPIDVAIIRGTSADELGNISMEEEPLKLGILGQAMAARASGGRVIAQVKRVVPAGSLRPDIVVVPSVLVDAIVVDPDQLTSERFPGLQSFGIDGERRVDLPPAPGFPHSIDKVIGRRAVLELQPGDTVNYGGGTPRFMPVVMLEEDVGQAVDVTLEHAVLGGVNYGRMVHINPTSFLSYQELFGWYEGGGLNAVFLGFGQADRHGNVNLTRFGKETLRGPGGAIDLAEYGQRINFMGSFTYGRNQPELTATGLAMGQPGRPKFIEEVDQITINGSRLLRLGKTVKFLTERAVLELRDDGMHLTEIAPGVDVKRDILAQMDFVPVIDGELVTMDEAIFRDQRLGLREKWLGKDARRENPIRFVALGELPVAHYWSPELA